MLDLARADTEDIEFLRLHPWLLGKFADEEKETVEEQPPPNLDMPKLSSDGFDQEVETLRKNGPDCEQVRRPGRLCICSRPECCELHI